MGFTAGEYGVWAIMLGLLIFFIYCIGCALYDLNAMFQIFPSLIWDWVFGLKASKHEYTGQRPAFGDDIPLSGMKAPIMVLNQTACTSDLPPLEGTVAFVEFGECWIDQKAKNIQDAGALAAIFVASSQVTDLPSLDKSLHITIPAAVIKSGDFEVIRWANEVELYRTANQKAIDTDVAGFLGLSILLLGSGWAVYLAACNYQKWFKQIKAKLASKDGDDQEYTGVKMNDLNKTGEETADEHTIV